MDIIYINGIKCSCVIGVWEWERVTKQTLTFDLEFAADFDNAAKSDNLNDAVDYQQISERIVEFAEASSYQLIESLIVALANLLIDEFQLKWLRLSLDKGRAIKVASNVGLVIERGERS